VRAPARSRSPTLLATIAVVAMPVPAAIAKSKVIMASVRPTVASASVPRRETKKASVRAKTDSMTISRTIGMASSTIARPIGPVVKSSSLPESDSSTVCHTPLSKGASGMSVDVMATELT
jgi:hypothetical protein